jgi:C-terminal processing protease CtpA/Prc
MLPVHRRKPALRRWLLYGLSALMALAFQCGPLSGQESGEPLSAPILPAPILVDEGGPVVVSGLLHYTNPFFTAGVTQPLIVLEDQAGFVDRNPAFVMPLASQTLGQITGDFQRSPFSYTLSLPVIPQASLRDIDYDGVAEPGVMVFALAYWANLFGSPFLEVRDLMGGGWSSAYASTRVSAAAGSRGEVTGGKLLVFAPDAAQDFPAGFGPDGRLFTADDQPIVRLPQGYTLVDLDATPFVFDRTARPQVDLIEPDDAALADFSGLGYDAAFAALIDKLRREYAFTETKGIDWDALAAQFAPRMAEAERTRDRAAYLLALRDFSLSIPDGHIQGLRLTAAEQGASGGGLGLTLAELDDDRVLVVEVAEDGPAARAGIQARAEILLIDGRSIQAALAQTISWNGPFSTDHVRRLQQLQYVVRGPVGKSVLLTYRPAGVEETVTVTLAAEAGFTRSSAPSTGFELPVAYERLPSGYGYVRLGSFLDDVALTVQLWERLMRTLNRQQTPGLIIDIRQNTGGSGFLADQLAAYLFDEALELGRTGRYNAELDEFYFDPRLTDRFYLPAPTLRYHGPVAVLVGPACSSACEFFAYALTQQERAAIVGHYPTAGVGGSISQLRMPEGQMFQFTSGRAVDMAGEIHIEGKGVAPTVRVPVNEETLFAEGDVLLAAAEAYLDALR